MKNPNNNNGGGHAGIGTEAPVPPATGGIIANP